MTQSGTAEIIAGGRPRCPVSDRKGRRVPPATLRSLLTPAARQPHAGLEGFLFCDDPDCDVVYFHPQTAETYQRRDLRVSVGQKERDRGRMVCYCFGHTAAEIEDEVAQTGRSTIRDAIADKCRQGLDRCQQTNPQGRCCLGDVRAVEREMLSKAPTERGDEGGGTRRWVIGGAVATAVLSSACCWLPLLLVGVGISATGVAALIEPLRPWLLGSSIILLLGGFYMVYVRRPAGSTETSCSSCDAKGPRWRRVNRLVLWVAAIVVLAFALFPSYSGLLIGAPATAADPSRLGAEVRFYEISGMTCAGCAASLQPALAAIPGVAEVAVDYGSSTARVVYDANDVAEAEGLVLATTESFGYGVTSRGLAAGNDDPAEPERTPLERSTTGAEFLAVGADLEPFIDHFNANVERTRVLAVVSPICPVCIAGARAVEEAILSRFPDADVAVDMVWLPMLPGDNEQAARRSGARYADDDRVTQFWDPECALGRALAQGFGESDQVAWDIYLIYPPGVTWGASSPAPADYAHQLQGRTWVDPERYAYGQDLVDALTRATGEVLARSDPP